MSTNIISALDTAIGGSTALIIQIVGRFVCPILLTICAILFLLMLFKAGLEVDKMKGQLQEHMGQFIMLIIVILATGSFSSWVVFFK